MLKYLIMKQRYSFRSNAVKFRILTLILFVFFMGGNMAWAWVPENGPGIYRLYSYGTSGNNFNVFYAADENATSTQVATNQSSIVSFKIASGTYRIIFENTRTINMTGQIYIDANDGTQAHLIMELGEGGTHTADNPTLRIGNISSVNGQAMAFFILKKNISDHTQHTITIKGIAPSPGTNEDIDNFVYDFSNNFVIDGSGPELELVDGNTWEPKVEAKSGTGTVVGSGMFRIQEGSLTLQHVTVQRFSSSYSNANLIQVFPDPKTTPNVTVNIMLDHCYFYQIGVGSGYNATFEFPIERFCRNFKRFPIPTISALRILTRAGYTVGAVTRSVKGDGPVSCFQVIPQVFHKLSLSQVYNSSYWR